MNVCSEPVRSVLLNSDFNQGGMPVNNTQEKGLPGAPLFIYVICCINDFLGNPCKVAILAKGILRLSKVPIPIPIQSIQVLVKLLHTQDKS